MNISDLKPGSYTVNTATTQPPTKSLYNSFNGSFANETSPTQNIIQKFGGAIKNAAVGANNFVQSLPQAAEQAAVGTPARFIASAAEAPKVLATGKATGNTYDIPGLQPFQSIQTQEQQNMNQGESPLKAGAKAGINAVGSGLATAGGIEGGLESAEAAPEAIKGLANDTANTVSSIGNKISDVITPKGDSAIHLPEQGNIYAKITPEQQEFLNNEVKNIPSDSNDKPHLTPLTKLESPEIAQANTKAEVPAPKQVSLDEIKQASPNAKSALDNFDNQNKSKIGDSEKVAQDAIKNPLSEKEQQTAVGQRRANVEGIGKKIEYSPDSKNIAMTKALKPLVEDGKIVSPKTPEEHISNVSNTQDEIASQSKQIRQGLGTSKAIWNGNELQGRLDSIDLPNVVKSEPALTKQAENFKSGILNLADEVDKKPTGLLDLRQKTDDLINQDFGKNFFDQDKNSTAMRNYIYSVRDELNQFAADKLPDGKLPDGTSYRDALQNQHQLINAKDEMTQKFVREYPEGSTATSRFMKAHPLVARALRSAPMRVGFSLLGIGALGVAARKALTGK